MVLPRVTPLGFPSRTVICHTGVGTPACDVAIPSGLGRVRHVGICTSLK